MPYIKEVCVAGVTIEVRKYHNIHTPPSGEKRGQKGKPTPERVKKANRMKAERELRRLMNANFTDRDYSLTLSYRNGEVPESIADLRADAAEYARKLKKVYAQEGVPFKWVYCVGAGLHRRHVHMVVSAFPDMGVISDAWEKGHVSMTKLYTKGNYADLAAYYIRNGEETREQEEEQGLKPRRRYNTSHNLTKPKIMKEIVNAKSFHKTPKPMKGYRIIKDTVVYGRNEFNGMPYLAYMQIRDRDYAGDQPIHTDGTKDEHKRKRTRGIRAGGGAEGKDGVP